VSHGAAANCGRQCPILSTRGRRDGNRGLGKNVEIYSEKLKIELKPSNSTVEIELNSSNSSVEIDKRVAPVSQ
jgi:hypothetical protein